MKASQFAKEQIIHLL
jgi:putative transposase